MAKIIRLTEDDIQRMVKKIIKETIIFDEDPFDDDDEVEFTPEIKNCDWCDKEFTQEKPFQNCCCSQCERLNNNNLGNDLGDLRDPDNPNREKYYDNY
jgi:hypothetical protein